MKISQALVAVTYKCNSKCSMCNIWKNKNVAELDLNCYKKLPPIKTVNISGGEPFLRKDIVDVVNIFDDISDRIVISSNGLLPDLIERKIKEMPHVGVGISIDGTGNVHDKIRGIKGAYDKSLDTINRLIKLDIEDLRIALTISDTNANQIIPIYELANELGVEFTCAIVHNSDIYFNTSNNVVSEFNEINEGLKYLIENELSTWVPKRWFRAYFYAGLVNFIKNKSRMIECDAGTNSFFLDPYGDIYPCNILGEKMGNLTQDSFDSIWNSERSTRVRSIVKSCNYNCWMVCTAASVMRTKPYIPMWWIIKNKMHHIFGGVVK